MLVIEESFRDRAGYRLNKINTKKKKSYRTGYKKTLL